MKTWAKWTLSVAVVSIAGCGTKFALDDHKQRVVLREDEAKDAIILAEMQSEFPVGTPREQVVSGLRAHHRDVYDSTLDIDIWLDHEPSFVWFCNFMEPYIEFKFHGQSPSAPLKSVERHTTGECL
jgi:hypothetical protein